MNPIASDSRPESAPEPAPETAPDTRPDTRRPDTQSGDLVASAAAVEMSPGETPLLISAAERLPPPVMRPRQRHPLLWTGLVLSVALLATILLWPAGDELPQPVTARSEILEIEQRLDALAFPPGKIDGVADQATAAAIRDFQRAAGLSEDGRATLALLAELRALGD